MNERTNDRKTGCWIVELGDFSGYYQCSACKNYALAMHAVCPYCGAKMCEMGGEDAESKLTYCPEPSARMDGWKGVPNPYD